MGILTVKNLNFEASDIDSFELYIDLCLIIKNFYLPSYKQVFFIEDECGLIKGKITDGKSNIDVFEFLKQHEPEVFSFYVNHNLFNDIQSNDYQTNWFYNKLKNIGIPVKTFFENKKLKTDFVNLEDFNLDLSVLCFYLFKNKKYEEYFINNEKDLYALKEIFLKNLDEKYISYIQKVFLKYRSYKLKFIFMEALINFCIENNEEGSVLFSIVHNFYVFNQGSIKKIIDYNYLNVFEVLLLKEAIKEDDFLYCIENQKYDFIEKILSLHPELSNIFLSNSLTPLMIAARLVDQDMADIILKYGGDLNISTEEGIIASEMIPNFESCDDFFNYLESIRKNKEP